MPANREAIIQISATISKLREEAARVKEELKKHEAQLDRLLSGEQSPSVREIRSSAPDIGERSLNQQIIDLIESAPDKTFTADDIGAYLPDANITSIRSGLARLADQSRVQRSGRGAYMSLKVSRVQDQVTPESEQVHLLE